MRQERRSRSIFLRSSPATLREQLAHQIESVELVVHPGSKLGLGHQHETGWGIEKDERGSFDKSGPRTYLCRDDYATTVSHYHSVCPTHMATVPLSL